MTIYVLDKDGRPQMPTFNVRKVRKLIKEGRMKTVRRDPWTVQKQYEDPEQDVPRTQKVEMCCDTGASHVGVSIKSEKHEYARVQFNHLAGEKERHDDRRKARRSRRIRKRHRTPRFDNRKREKGWLAPTLQNKVQNHVRICKRYHDICPITSVTLEVGTFDTMALQAQEAGQPLPSGTDYQRGPRFGYDNLREAVFSRDNYTCIVCGSTIGKRKKKDGKYVKADVILRMHHLGFKNGDHSDRMSNLATVCTACHTAKAHKPGGALYELEPELPPFRGAAFMNTARWEIIKRVKECMPEAEFHITYGAVTKRERHSLRMKKDHVTDAYCMGKFRPKHKAKKMVYDKRRRNNRILEKFYDKVIIDIRDGEKKKGSKLSCGRSKRSESRRTEKNERIYRGVTVSKGRRSIRTRRYPIQSGTVCMVDRKKLVSAGCQHYGEWVTFKGHDAEKVEDVRIYHQPRGWLRAQ